MNTGTHLPPVLQARRTRLFARLVANGVAQALAAVSIVLLVQWTFDRLITTAHPAPFSLLLWVGVGLAAATGCMAWLRTAERVDAERMGQDYTHQIRTLLF
ncbi:MAG: ABC transporter ATP-binding protein, partial [Candidatus Binatia bacterium]